MADRLFASAWPLFGEALPRELVFIPSGGLNMFPLHLLRRRGAADGPLLIEEMDISYAPSINALIRAGELAELPVGDALLAICDPAGNLPHAHAEIAAVERWFASPRSVVLRGSAATPARVEHLLRGFDAAHFACHGAQAADPYLTNLLLADPASASPAVSAEENADGPMDFTPRKIKIGRAAADRGRWTLNRILAVVRLPRAPVVVLSACESGLTSAERLPDELIGLPAGFLAAGARSVIASLWLVDDRATAELMAEFYRAWRGQHLSPRAALASAQRAMLASGHYSCPLYWGAFTITGA